MKLHTTFALLLMTLAAAACKPPVPDSAPATRMTPEQAAAAGLAGAPASATGAQPGETMTSSSRSSAPASAASKAP